MTDIIKLIRPYQWLKNLFIFLPLFFDRHLFDVEYLIPCCFMFFSYCFMASAIYCFNDIHDADADKNHPQKCKRPIASGAISKTMAYAIMIVCIALSYSILAFGDFEIGGAN